MLIGGNKIDNIDKSPVVPGVPGLLYLLYNPGNTVCKIILNPANHGSALVLSERIAILFMLIIFAGK
jgi:hypothetical protein